MAYHFLIDQGFENVSRFSGGLSAWEEAGYPLEGVLVE
jgi:rhodanese-related sulfurtransferase